MCRNIKVLSHFDPPATREEIYAASLQFVRKIAGSGNPANINEGAYATASMRIASVAAEFLESLSFKGPHRNRERELEKGRERNKKRFANAV